MSDDLGHMPDTAIVLGSGCSAQLGVPTMVNFMDRAIERLSPSSHRTRSSAGNRASSDDGALKTIQKFIEIVKGSAAYVRTDLLNIEELYGLAEMEHSLNSPKPEKAKIQPSDTQRAFNYAIFALANEAGKEFISDSKRFINICNDIETITRESHNENPGGADNCTRYTNLVAYLALAAFGRSAQTSPLIIQFNWDLALDRALYLSRLAKNKPGRIKNVPDFADKMEYEGVVEVLRGVRQNKRGEKPSDKIAAMSAILAEYFPWIRFSSQNADRGTEASENAIASLVRRNHDFTDCPLVLRPHGSINWTKDELNDKLAGYCGDEASITIATESKADNSFYAVITKLIFDKNDDEARNVAVAYMNISPPTWKKNIEQFHDQWFLMMKYLERIRRIIFIGYSMPRTDLYFRHFLALALAKNNNAPRVYVWNPSITRLGPVHDSYLDLFAPLAREGRLFAIDGYFGDPALYDLNRVFHLAKRLDIS